MSTVIIFWFPSQNILKIPISVRPAELMEADIGDAGVGYVDGAQGEADRVENLFQLHQNLFIK